jgi:hypothetical protein
MRAVYAGGIGREVEVLQISCRIIRRELSDKNTRDQPTTLAANNDPFISGVNNGLMRLKKDAGLD